VTEDVPDDDGEFRLLGAQGVGDPGDERTAFRAGADGQAHRGRRPAPGSAEPGHQMVDGADDRGSFLREDLTRGCQPHVPAVADEQQHPEVVLEPADDRGQRLMGHVQLPRRPAEVQAVGHGQQGALRRAVPEPAAGDLPPLDDLVAGINTVGFAPGSADDTQATRAGHQAVAYADELRTRRSRWRRLWWSLHPGPLRWHR
jgi:hypothetical protein